MKTVTRSALWLSCVLALMSTAACAPGAGRSGSLPGTPAVGTTVLAVAPMDATGSGGRFASLRSTAPTSALPKRLMVYRVKPANIAEGDVEARGRRLGLKGRVEDRGDRFLIADEAATYEVDKATGSFDYTTDAFEAQTEPLRGMLTDGQYRERAEAFLADAGLMEASAEFRDVNRANVVGTQEGGKWVERPYMIEVRFSHKPLDGIAFDKGVGPKIVVQFGEDGRVLGALSVWRDVEPFASYVLKTPGEAVSAAEGGEAQLFNVGGDDAGTVEAMTLSYINEPLGYDQRYVMPSYILRGSKEGGGRFTGIVRAIPDALLRIDASLRGPAISAPLSTGKK